MTTRRLGPTALTIVSAALLTGALVSPAHATTPRAVVSATFTDSDHAPVHDVHVTATRGTVVVDLGMTDREGDIARRSGTGRTRLTPGTWTFVAVDREKNRTQDRMRFAPAVVTRTIKAGGNDLGDHALDDGARLGGSVYAPSGAALRNVTVGGYVQRGHLRVEQPTGRTGRASGFALIGVGLSGEPVSTVHVTASHTKSGAALERTGVVRTVQGRTTDNGLMIEDWQVRCDTTFRVGSRHGGKVGLALTSTASWAGVDHPGGEVVVRRGSTVVRRIDWSDRSSYRTTLTGQPRGKRVVYTATATGGDCLPWRSSAAVRLHR